MTVPALLAELRNRDVHVWADGDQLRCNAPADFLSPELRAQLQQRKRDILDFLELAGTLARLQPALVPLQPSGDRPPILGVPGHNGDVFCYQALARHLGSHQPFYGLQPPGVDGQSEPLASVEDLATYFAEQILAAYQRRPCTIVGFCAGGAVAIELARRLLIEGMPVPFLGLFGAPYPTSYRRMPQLRKRLAEELENACIHMRTLAAQPWSGDWLYLREKVTQRWNRRAQGDAPPDPVLEFRQKVENATIAAASRYTPRRFAGRVCLFLPSDEWVRSSGVGPLRWRTVAEGVEEYIGPLGCDGANMLREPYVSTFATLVAQCQPPLEAAGR